MKIFSTGAPVVSAAISTVNEAGEVVVNTVAKGDTISGLVLAAPARRFHPGCPIPVEDITIEPCTVVGFTLKGLNVPRGATTIFDGVPTYLRDPSGECFHGTVEETSEIDRMIIEIPAEEEGAAPIHRVIHVAAIKEIGNVAAGEDSGEGETGGGTEENPPQA